MKRLILGIGIIAGIALTETSWAIFYCATPIKPVSHLDAVWQFFESGIKPCNTVGGEIGTLDAFEQTAEGRKLIWREETTCGEGSDVDIILKHQDRVRQQLVIKGSPEEQAVATAKKLHDSRKADFMSEEIEIGDPERALLARYRTELRRYKNAIGLPTIDYKITRIPDELKIFEKSVTDEERARRQLGKEAPAAIQADLVNLWLDKFARASEGVKAALDAVTACHRIGFPQCHPVGKDLVMCAIALDN